MVNRRVVVILPDNLVKAVDKIVNQRYDSRSAFVREAMQHFLEDCQMEELREKMARGYQRMGRINLELSEEGLADDAGDMEDYCEMLMVGENG